jgi:hypothetical protein
MDSYSSYRFSNKESRKLIEVIIEFWRAFTLQEIEQEDVDNLKTHEGWPFVLSQWLSSDIVSALQEKNEEEQKNELVKVESWLKEELGLSLYQKLTLVGFSFDVIQRRLAIRNDWKKALNEVKLVDERDDAYDTTPIARELGYSLYDSDLKELATIHKEEEDGSKLQLIIESLLTTLNFHEDCGEFIAGYYDNYLSL